jgi:hypothetical protein
MNSWDAKSNHSISCGSYWYCFQPMALPLELFLNQSNNGPRRWGGNGKRAGEEQRAAAPGEPIAEGQDYVTPAPTAQPNTAGARNPSTVFFVVRMLASCGSDPVCTLLPLFIFLILNIRIMPLGVFGKSKDNAESGRTMGIILTGHEIKTIFVKIAHRT